MNNQPPPPGRVDSAERNQGRRVATHMLKDGYDIGTILDLLGHKGVKATMLYTQVLNPGGRGVKSPVDSL